MNGNGIIYQFDSLLRPGLHHTFKWYRFSASAMGYQSPLFLAFNAVHSPEKALVVPGFGDTWTPILISGEDIERGKNARYSEVQHSKRQMTSGTNPVVGGV
jgi:hypothetical protein